MQYNPPIYIMIYYGLTPKSQVCWSFFVELGGKNCRFEQQEEDYVKSHGVYIRKVFLATQNGVDVAIDPQILPNVGHTFCCPIVGVRSFSMLGTPMINLWLRVLMSQCDPTCTGSKKV